MKYLSSILAISLWAIASVSMAQEDDDMYFTSRKKSPKKTQRIEVIYEQEDDVAEPLQSKQGSIQLGSTRDVDEYNRRGRTPLVVDSMQTDSVVAVSYELSAQSLYDLGYDEGYAQGVEDAEEMDFYYGMRLARFHGIHCYDPWYWNRVSVIYDPWYWDPWYYDPWYRPYYYGGWYSVGWGIGHYWGHGYWDPYWPGYYPHHYPHHHHPHYPHHPSKPGIGNHSPSPRNRDYARTRIVDRGVRMGASGRNTNRSEGVGNRDLRRDPRSNRVTDRSSTRSERATNRNQERGNGTIDRSTNRTDRNSTRRRESNSGRNVDRSSRSTQRSVISGSPSRENGSFGPRGGSGAGSRHGGGGARTGGGGRRR